MSEQPKKLHRTAYELKEGEVYQPYSQGQDLKEFTFKAVICGIILGVIFGAANVYLGLVAGLTISTSIPVAVLTVVAFKALSAAGSKHSILEANMSQTVGSASSSVASGVLFTLPALFLWGMDPALLQIAMLAMAGGLLGILAMIPLRRYLIKKEHGKLPYPEGMACAEVLVAAEHGGKQARNVFWGLAAGMGFKLFTSGFKFVSDKLSLDLFFKANLSLKVSPALIGVGYILGLRIATIMVAGAALSSLVIIPAIFIWGQDLTAPFYPETEILIKDMSAGDIWNRYIRYIGAGAVATGGIITLIQSIPSMVESFKIGLAQIGKKVSDSAIVRTDRDLSLRTIAIFVFGILLLLTLVPGILGFLDSVKVRGLAAILIAVFAFFFVTVSSRIVGLVGVTSNPTSGMTIATLIGTSLIFYLMGWDGPEGKATALMVGTAVCIAASIAGDTSQDLKTGFLLGATPRYQQIGELVGVMTSSIVICWVLIILNDTMTLGSAELPAPQATLMKLVIDGVLEQQLPWNLIFIGVGIALLAFFVKIPPLPFAVGVYLPLSTMAPVFVGGLLRHFLTRKGDEKEREERKERGVLFGSGLVGGEGLTGVVLALSVLFNNGEKIKGFPLVSGYWPKTSLSLLTLAALLWLFIRLVRKRP